MKSVKEALDERRSTRRYLDKEIAKEDEKFIEEAIINSPTAGNMTLYSVIKIKNEETKEKLSILCDNQPFIKSAKMVMVFLTNSSRWYDAYNKINDTDLKPTLADYYLGMCDALIAAQSAVIAAEAINIGSCYIGDIVENYEKIKELLKLPKYVNVACLLTFGYKEEGFNQTRPKRFNKEDIIFDETYQDINIKAFENKYGHLNEEERIAKAQELVNRTFSFKMKSEFFKEMNRSMKLIIEEYID